MGVEKILDDIIDYGVKLFKSQKRTLFVLAVILVTMFSSKIIRFVQNDVLSPVMNAIDDGISTTALAHAFALGVCSGLSAPGLTMFVLFGMAKLMASLSIPVDATMIAIAAAVNAGLTVPDVIIWKNIYAQLGGKFLSGGRYIRPFISGAIPWAISVIPLYSTVYFIVSVLSFLGKKIV
jgi:hypothetical protein